ncbi:hypothetical protein LCGC14_2866920 [marine sediment metagenome]|uniref:Uncharacterized protein n=1 Tax=marine sediment metagenome TaxID=412755 RepID=A0A0F8XY12_9ZZZZ
MSLKLGEEETIITIHVTGNGRCSLQGDDISLFTFLNAERKIKVIIKNKSLRLVRILSVLLDCQSEMLSVDPTEILTYKIIKAKKEKVSIFTILPKKRGNFTIDLTLQGAYRLLARFSIKIFVMSSLYQETIRTYLSIPSETFTLNVYSESDGTFSLEGDQSYHLYQPSQFVLKNST